MLMNPPHRIDEVSACQGLHCFRSALFTSLCLMPRMLAHGPLPFSWLDDARRTFILGQDTR